MDFINVPRVVLADLFATVKNEYIYNKGPTSLARPVLPSPIPLRATNGLPQTSPHLPLVRSTKKTALFLNRAAKGEHGASLGGHILAWVVYMLTTGSRACMTWTIASMNGHTLA